MSISRRKFISTAAAGAALTGSEAFAAPFRISVQRDAASTPAAARETVPLAIPSTMPMGSGAPLGGIGTGFVEIRADGCFHEWQIFNAGPWAQDVRSTTRPPAAGPQSPPPKT